ncbi:MAG: hypothetical protein V4557_17605 [Bacteroidota bacterium]
MKISFLLFASLISSAVFAQIETKKIADSIIAEAKEIYRSEMASWYGSEIFEEKFKQQKQNTGGHFSYKVSPAQTNCVFFSTANDPKVLATIIFDSNYISAKAQIDSKQREFTLVEKDLYSLQKAAVHEVKITAFFKEHKNTNFNFVPLIQNGEKKVYILTSARDDRSIILGSDYLLTFNSENKLISKKQLHPNFVSVKYDKTTDNPTTTAHRHASPYSDFITPTDICTLMLYEKFIKWEKHMVVSKDWTSIWDCQANTLTINKSNIWNKLNFNNQ